MQYVLDTNVVLFYLRKHPLGLEIDNIYAPFSPQNEAILSVVSVGELYALAKMNKWGATKLNSLEIFFKEFIITSIQSKDVLEAYAEIEAYSQCRLEGFDYSFSARNMGKNDIWIAATARVLGATLLTTDKDFNHLSPNLLNLKCLKSEL